METLTEGVVSESPENSVNTETPVDGNVSMAEFADQLLKRKQANEAEPEASTEETDEPSDQTEEPTEVTEETTAEETEGDTPSPQPSENVLSKYGIDLDNLSSEEIESFAKALNLKAVKRISNLAAQKKALASENAELQAQAEQAQQTQSSEIPDFLKDNALHLSLIHI